jgi:serine/threonine protein phosphatase 1
MLKKLIERFKNNDNKPAGVKIPLSAPLEQYWVIGDVHGCMFTLEDLIKKLPKDAKLIFVGDLVDRGKHSKEVMEFVLQNNHLIVEGNHEYLMFNYARDAILRDKKSIWLEDAYGGLATIKSYKDDTDTLLKHIDYIEKMPKYIEIDKYFITHGFGLPFYLRKDLPQYKEKLYTNRLESVMLNDFEAWDEYEIINIFGHTPYQEVLFGKNYIGIDTGCVFGMTGGKLSAVNLGTHRIVSEWVDDMDIV